MPGSSKVRRSARKRDPPRQYQAVEQSSPSRPSKRRKGNTATMPPPPTDPEINEDEVEEHENDSDEDEIQQLTQLADQVAPFLHEAQEATAVQTQHPNKEVDHSISAYAKIAGRSWTYYARELVISIGRVGEGRSSLAPGTQESVEETEAPAIDLGPSKHVSREHAEIRYHDENWYLHVKGRNGAKQNGDLVKKNQVTELRSGDVMEIANTEMIFTLPDKEAVVHARYADRLKMADGVKLEEQALPGPPGWATQSHAHPAGALLQAAQIPPAQHISPYAPALPGTVQASVGVAPYIRPLTPPNPLLQHPYLAQQAQAAPHVNTTPGFQPSMMETNEQPDYAGDAAKDIKPPMSYATLIAQAILAGPNEKSSLNGIYEWIKNNFAYYRHIEQSWQNSIRHNLSLNPAFQKIPRQTHEPGKGGMWFITEEKKDEFKRMGWKMTSRGGARPASNPSSPAPNKKSPKRRTPPRPTTFANTSDGLQNTPPSQSQPQIQMHNSQTPVRLSASSVPKLEPGPQLFDDNSPLPHRQSLLSRANGSAGSPPTLSSSALLDDNINLGYASNPFTPAPRRHEPNFAAPSTMKLPSQYLLQSSPAPFWKGLETPAALPETSPVKMEHRLANSALGVPPQSSSPPPDTGIDSPINSRVSTRATPVEPRTNVGLGIHQPAMARVQKDQPDGQLDLMGDFRKIGENRAVNPAH